jgi:hypothetical protein
VNMGSSLRDGKASGGSGGETHRETPRPAGVAVWAEYSERGKAAYRGKAHSRWALPVTQVPEWQPRGTPVGRRGTVTGDEAANRC